MSSCSSLRILALVSARSQGSRSQGSRTLSGQLHTAAARSQGSRTQQHDLRAAAHSSTQQHALRAAARSQGSRTQQQEQRQQHGKEVRPSSCVLITEPAMKGPQTPCIAALSHHWDPFSMLQRLSLGSLLIVTEVISGVPSHCYIAHQLLIVNLLVSGILPQRSGRRQWSKTADSSGRQQQAAVVNDSRRQRSTTAGRSGKRQQAAAVNDSRPKALVGSYCSCCSSGHAPLIWPRAAQLHS